MQTDYPLISPQQMLHDVQKIHANGSNIEKKMSKVHLDFFCMRLLFPPYGFIYAWNFREINHMQDDYNVFVRSVLPQWVTKELFCRKLIPMKWLFLEGSSKTSCASQKMLFLPPLFLSSVNETIIKCLSKQNSLTVWKLFVQSVKRNSGVGMGKSLA